MIVGFAGVARSGKDAAGAVLVAHGFERYSFAGPLKETCRELFGLGEDQLHGDAKDVVDPRHGVTPRVLLMRVADAAPHGTFSNAFIAWHAARISRDPRVTITDVRFPHEVDAIRGLGGRVFRIDRPFRPEEAGGHASERPSRLSVDGVILNDGTLEDLRAAVLRLVS